MAEQTRLVKYECVVRYEHGNGKVMEAIHEYDVWESDKDVQRSTNTRTDHIIDVVKNGYYSRETGIPPQRIIDVHMDLVRVAGERERERY